jgi:hypothetical protein
MSTAMVKRTGLFGGPILGLICYHLLPVHSRSSCVSSIWYCFLLFFPLKGVNHREKKESDDDGRTLIVNTPGDPPRHGFFSFGGSCDASRGSSAGGGVCKL